MLGRCAVERTRHLLDEETFIHALLAESGQVQEISLIRELERRFPEHGRRRRTLFFDLLHRLRHEGKIVAEQRRGVRRVRSLF